MTEQQGRLDFFCHQQSVPPGAIVAMGLMLAEGENLDVINGDLIVRREENGAVYHEFAAARFPDFKDLLTQNYVSNALKIQLSGRQPYFAKPPQKYQAEQTLDVQAALAKYYLLSKVSAPNG